MRKLVRIRFEFRSKTKLPSALLVGKLNRTKMKTKSEIAIEKAFGLGPETDWESWTKPRHFHIRNYASYSWYSLFAKAQLAERMQKHDWRSIMNDLRNMLNPMLNDDTQEYNDAQTETDREICNVLARTISAQLPTAENKIWHRHPVWFLDGNPIVGYSKLKDCVRLMFWSGATFDEEKLTAGTGKFKDASIRYTSADQIVLKELRNWLKKAETIQWDYKNLVKRKGVLERLK